MNQSKDYISSFEQQLEASAELLENCSSLESSLDDLIANDRKFLLSQLSSTIDATALSLNKGFLHCINVEKYVSRARIEADKSERACQARKESALSHADAFESIREVYSGDIFNGEIYHGRRHATEMSRYATFCRKLLRARNLDPQNISTGLLNALYKDYEKQQQSRDDDELAIVGDSVIKPICLVSSRPLREPVRAKCGHYFSKQEILEAIENSDRRSLRCPSAGCSQFIESADLVRDPLKDLEVKIWLREEERRRLEDTQSMATV